MLTSAPSAEAIMLDALRLSVGTLTIVPSGSIAEIDRRTAARAMIIAPLAVLPLATAVALLGWLARAAGRRRPCTRQSRITPGRTGRHD